VIGRVMWLGMVGAGSRAHHPYSRRPCVQAQHHASRRKPDLGPPSAEMLISTANGRFTTWRGKDRQRNSLDISPGCMRGRALALDGPTCHEHRCKAGIRTAPGRCGRPPRRKGPADATPAGPGAVPQGRRVRAAHSQTRRGYSALAGQRAGWGWQADGGR
jgi:hypothetical protein